MAKKGRPTDNPADYQFRVRLTQDDKTKLSECADKLKINKSDVIRRGIDVIHKGLSE